MLNADSSEKRIEDSEHTQAITAVEFDEKGLSCAVAGDYNSAISNYLQAISIDRFCLSAYYHCAIAYIRLRDYDNALEMITKLLKLCPPPMASLYEMRGTVNYCLKRYDAAIEDYNRTIEIKPEAASAYYGRGAAHAELEEYEKAVVDVAQSAKLGCPDAWLLLKQVNSSSSFHHST